MSDNSSLLLNFRSGKCFGCLNHLGLEILTSPTLSRVRTVSRSLVVDTVGDMALRSRSAACWHDFLLRSRGMSVTLLAAGHKHYIWLGKALTTLHP